MKLELVADANIIIAAMLRPGMTRSIIFRPDVSLCAPQIINVEIGKYREEFIRRSGLNEKEYDETLSIILSNVEIVPAPEYEFLAREAQKISPDHDDWAFFALALIFDRPIWSNEKILKDQKKVKVYNTEEICRLLMP